MSLTLIVATSNNNAIGCDNKMLWHLPAELAHFKRTTLHKTVLMGRKTFESLGKPLPNRTNVVLSRQTGLIIEGCEVVHSVEEAIEKYGAEELMITGGAEIYKLFMPYIDKMFITKVDVEITNADAYFPSYNEQDFELIHSEKVMKDEKNNYNFTIYTYNRVK
ncbi:MAG TPA: dihydrofolate reductase [Candidatus Paenibacillus intestinavium]|nr:dihydrofolate reductase [Candidatus Paenibacillus intestinavium]